MSDHSRPTSTSSSTQPFLSEAMPSSLNPPSAPFASTSPSVSRSSSRPSSTDPLQKSSSSNLSLSVNYLPTKFSNPLLAGGPRRRSRQPRGHGILVPKQGGGVEAFRSGEARMPDEGDDDYDGVASGWFGGRHATKSKPTLRWNRFKWTLLVANSVLTAYSIVTLILLLMTWFNVWNDADIIRVGNRSELVISTIASSIGIVTCIIGWSGILLNNRSFLAIYTFLLWVVFVFLVAPGYITYKRRALNLEGKINQQWSQDIPTSGRLRVQNHLGCCGYYSPFIEATVSQTCYARSVLPGCKRDYLMFQRRILKNWYTASFALVGPHMLIMLVGLLCSNHVTYRFGKGMMPKPYRLSMNSMAVIMDNYASQLAEQYGEDVASEVLTHSRSNRLDVSREMRDMPYVTPIVAPRPQHGYDSMGARAPPSPDGGI